MRFHRTRRSPWWLVWAATLGAGGGLFASGLPGVSVTLATLVGLAFGMFCWGILQDRHDKYVAVKLPEEPKPLVRASTEEEG